VYVFSRKLDIVDGVVLFKFMLTLSMYLSRPSFLFIRTDDGSSTGGQNILVHILKTPHNCPDGLWGPPNSMSTGILSQG
jgi:hypothetical protein